MILSKYKEAEDIERYTTFDIQAYSEKQKMNAANPQTDKQSQVSKQLEQLKETLAELEKTISILTERLHPVLRVDEQSNHKDVPIATQLVPLADNIRSYRHSVESIRDRIRDLLSTIEL
jgi:archaellum component FlaC